MVEDSDPPHITFLNSPPQAQHLSRWSGAVRVIGAHDWRVSLCHVDVSVGGPPFQVEELEQEQRAEDAHYPEQYPGVSPIEVVEHERNRSDGAE